jgi:di/tricarboxylate transporter
MKAKTVLIVLIVMTTLCLVAKVACAETTAVFLITVPGVTSVVDNIPDKTKSTVEVFSVTNVPEKKKSFVRRLATKIAKLSRFGANLGSANIKVKSRTSRLTWSLDGSDESIVALEVHYGLKGIGESSIGYQARF